MEKEITEYLDILGQTVSVGNYVVAAKRTAYSSSMTICKVIRMTPKRLVLKGIKGPYNPEFMCYSSETVKLSGEEAMVYILKYS